MKNGNLCDCGNIFCDYNDNQHLDPATCTCQQSNSKRSIDKRDTDYSNESEDYLHKFFDALNGDHLDFDIANKTNL